MTKTYYEMIDTMEKQGVNPEYINGWASGHLHNPKREVQRITQAYDAGYADGWDKKADGYSSWIGPQ